MLRNYWSAFTKMACTPVSSFGLSKLILSSVLPVCFRPPIQGAVDFGFLRLVQPCGVAFLREELRVNRRCSHCIAGLPLVILPGQRSK